MARSNKETLKQMHELIGKGNANAFHHLGNYYREGTHTLPQDDQKAVELYLKAAELGCALAYSSLADMYRLGGGVDMDKKKAKYYYELAAIGGHVNARYNLATMEGREQGKFDRAIKHYVIAARAGHAEALNCVYQNFRRGYIVTKDVYESTLLAYHDRNKEMKSDMRDNAAKAKAAAVRRGVSFG